MAGRNAWVEGILGERRLLVNMIPRGAAHAGLQTRADSSVSCTACVRRPVAQPKPKHTAVISDGHGCFGRVASSSWWSEVRTAATWLKQSVPLYRLP